MVGRLTNRFTWREIVELYRITEPYIAPVSNMRPRDGQPRSFAFFRLAPVRSCGHAATDAGVLHGDSAREQTPSRHDPETRPRPANAGDPGGRGLGHMARRERRQPGAGKGRFADDGRRELENTVTATTFPSKSRAIIHPLSQGTKSPGFA
jgi:hypothetical protein